MSAASSMKFVARALQRLRGAPWWTWLIVAVTMLVLLDLLSLLTGGGSIDPTDPSNFDHFALINDTGRPVTVQPCERPNCGKDGTLLGTGTLPPGGRVAANVLWGDGDHATFLVRTATAELGCVELDASKHHDAREVALSTAQPCP